MFDFLIGVFILKTCSESKMIEKFRFQDAFYFCSLSLYRLNPSHPVKFQCIPSFIPSPFNDSQQRSLMPEKKYKKKKQKKIFRGKSSKKNYQRKLSVYNRKADKREKKGKNGIKQDNKRFFPGKKKKNKEKILKKKILKVTTNESKNQTKSSFH